MKVTTELLEKLYNTVLWSSVIAFIASIFMPWVLIEDLDIKIYISGIMIRSYYMSESDFQIHGLHQLLNLLYISFLGAIVFSVMGVIGLGLKKGKKYKESRYMMIGSIPLICVSVTALLFNILIMMWINDSEVYSHAYNIIPLIMSVVMVIGSALLVVLVGRRSLSEVLKDRREKKESQMVVVTTGEPVGEDLPAPGTHHEVTPYGDDEDIPLEDEVSDDNLLTADREEENVEDDGDTTLCPNCSTELQGMELICPQCRANISKRCPNCQKLVSFFVEECPHCGFSGGGGNR